MVYINYSHKVFVRVLHGRALHQEDRAFNVEIGMYMSTYCYFIEDVVCSWHVKRRLKWKTTHSTLWELLLGIIPLSPISMMENGAFWFQQEFTTDFTSLFLRPCLCSLDPQPCFVAVLSGNCNTKGLIGNTFLAFTSFTEVLVGKSAPILNLPYYCM